MSREQPAEARGSSSGQGSFSRGVWLTSASTGISVALLFVEAVIAVRLLEPSRYGVYVLLTAVVNLLVMLGDVGAKSAITQLLASRKEGDQGTLVHSVLLFRLLVGVLLSLLIWLGRDLLALVDDSGQLVGYVAFIPLMLLAMSFDELAFGMLRGFHAHRTIAVATILRSVLRLALTLLLLTVFQLGVVALIYSWVLSYALSAHYGYIALPVARRRYDPALIKEMLRFGFPLYLTRFLWTVQGQIQVFLLGAFAGPVAVAFFSVAIRLPSGLQTLAESYITVFFPAITTLVSEGRQQEASRLLNRSLRLGSFVMALLALGAVAFNREIITLVFSARYADSGPAFALIMIGLHIFSIVNMMGYSLTAAGHPKRSLVENGARTTLSVVCDLMLIPVLGFVGPPLSTIISRYSTQPLALWLMQRSGYTVQARPYATQTVLLLLGAAVSWGLGRTALTYPTMVLCRVLLIGLFIVLNLALATVMQEDLAFLLPGKLKARLGGRTNTLLDSPHSSLP